MLGIKWGRGVRIDAPIPPDQLQAFLGQNLIVRFYTSILRSFWGGFPPEKLGLDKPKIPVLCSPWSRRTLCSPEWAEPPSLEPMQGGGQRSEPRGQDRKPKHSRLSRASQRTSS
jgi:hypothetical protein